MSESDLRLIAGGSCYRIEVELIFTPRTQAPSTCHFQLEFDFAIRSRVGRTVGLEVLVDEVDHLLGAICRN